MSGKISREEFKVKLNHLLTSLRKQISVGEYKVGEYLPSELILAEQYGLSKNSVRKGLEELVSEGLIVKKSRIGNQVISSQPFDQTILRVGYYPNLLKDAVFQKLIKQFEEENPSVKIQTISLPYDHYQQTVQDFMENEMLDAVTINYKDYSDFDTEFRNVFEPMNKNNSIYPFLQKPFETREYQDEVYVRPFVFSPIVLCYNKDHFDASGISYPDSGWKWDEALSAAGRLMNSSKEEGTCGLYFHPLSLNRWPIFLLQNRVAAEYSADGEVAMNGLLESVNLIRKIFDEQGIMQTFLSDSNKDAETLFVDQKASMIMSSYFSLNEIASHEVSYDIAPLPYLKDPKTLLLIIGLAVNKHSKKKKAAQSFVDFISSEETQERIRIETLSIPAVKKVAERQGGEKVYKPSRYFLFREIIPTFSLYTDLGLYSQELNELRKELRIYLSDLMDDKIFYQRISKNLSKKASVDSRRIKGGE
jgi:multiple sugar transport system substrate-binding protein